MSKIEHDSNLMNLFNESVVYFKQNYLEIQITAKTKITSGSFNEENIVQGSIHIYSHLDTDGLAAASILAKAFNREHFGYQITILKQLQEEIFIEIQKDISEKKFLFFCDFGSGQLNLFQKYLSDYNFIILDHHEILKNDKDTTQINGVQVNPYLVNINGSNDISGAGMAYLFSLSLNPKNKELAYLAVIGAVGDLQNSGPQNEFIGENQVILQDAVEENMIVTEVLPAISRSKSLSYALAYTLPVEIDEFKQDIGNTNNILKKIGIKIKTDLGQYRTLGDLSEIEKKKLTSEIVQLSIKNGNSDPTKIDKIIATNYLIKSFENYTSVFEAKDFSKLLNACGRLNKPSLGLAVCISGSETVMSQALELTEEYRKVLNESLLWIKNENRLTSLNSIQYFYGENMINENIIGVICSNLIFSKEIDETKPVFGYADSDNGYFKISARCTIQMVKKGINLSTAIRNVCVKIGIKERGGGHPPASGARVPANKILEFLEKIDIEINNQLRASKSISLEDFGI